MQEKLYICSTLLLMLPKAYSGKGAERGVSFIGVLKSLVTPINKGK